MPSSIRTNSRSRMMILEIPGLSEWPCAAGSPRVPGGSEQAYKQDQAIKRDNLGFCRGIRQLWPVTGPDIAPLRGVGRHKRA